MKNTLAHYWASTLLLFFLTTSTCLSAIPKDSLRFEELRKRITSLETDNKILSEKIGAVNMANDKILGAFYVLKGAVISVLLGVTIWNAYQNWKTNSARLVKIKESLHKDLEAIIAKDISSKVNSIEYDLKEQLQGNTHDIASLKIKVLLMNPAFEEYDIYDLRNEFPCTLCDILLAAIDQNNTGSFKRDFPLIIRDILEAVRTYLKNNKLSIEDKRDLYNAVKKVPSGFYDPYVAETLKSFDE